MAKTPQARRSTHPAPAPASTPKPAEHAPAKPAAPSGRMKVRATRMGYFGEKRIRDGDVFVIDAKEFSARWMERVDGRTPERITTGQEELRKKHDELLGEKTPAHGTPLVSDEDDNVAGGNPLG
jgi:hypothetical protein